MSVRRFWEWTCDACELEVRCLPGCGLPAGWLIYHEHGETKHACEDCATEMPDAQPPSAFGGSYYDGGPS